MKNFEITYDYDGVKRVRKKDVRVSDSSSLAGSLCRWDLRSTTPFCYAPECGATDWHSMSDFYGEEGSPEFVFCPYCGKRIDYTENDNVQREQNKGVTTDER